MPSFAKLIYETLGHAAWLDGCLPMTNLAAVRYFRITRSVQMLQIHIHPVITRWAPAHFGQPAHVMVEAYDAAEGTWKHMLNVDLPPFPETASASGLAFDAPENTPEPHILSVFTPPEGAYTCIRLICDLEHDVPQSHGEQWTRRENVPFGIFDKVELFGQIQSDAPSHEPIYNPPITHPHITLQAERLHEKGLTAQYEGGKVTYRSRYFTVAFAARRPAIAFMHWDAAGKDTGKVNLVSYAPPDWGDKTIGTGGPLMRLPSMDIPSIYWNGSLEVLNDSVTYRNLTPLDGLSMDVTFTIHEKGMSMRIIKRCERDIACLEMDDWRLCWNAAACITGCLGMPLPGTGRTGRVNFPWMLSAPGWGTMTVTSRVGQPTLQADSWRTRKLTWQGIQQGISHDKYGGLTLQAGTYVTELDFTLCPLLPESMSDVDPWSGAVPDWMLRNWHSVFTFRPELGGFSNNMASVNCHLSQYNLVEMSLLTRTPPGMPSMVDFLRYTIEMALLGGPGYGDCRDMYIDTDPSVLISAGGVYRGTHDNVWLERIKEPLIQCYERIISRIDPETGVTVCRTLSGNSGTHRWSCNSWDAMSFGHMDALTNLQTYRALRIMVTLAHALGETEIAKKCKADAQRLKTGFRKYLYNQETGRVVGWKSADGQLHDYGFAFFSYMAICYGLLEGDDALRTMQVYESMMEEAGLDFFHYGMPANLLSVPMSDVPADLGYRRKDGLDNYSIYINGCLMTNWMIFYLRALDMTGYTEKADRVCSHLEASLTDNRIVGGLFLGAEFFTWEGRPCGYEGVLVGQFPMLYAMAMHRSMVSALEPEWWME